MRATSRARQINSVSPSVSPTVSPVVSPREFEGESAEAKANLRQILLSGVRPAFRAYRVLNYVLSCVPANSKVSPLWLRQTGEKCVSPVCVPRPVPLHVLNCVLVCVLNCVR